MESGWLAIAGSTLWRRWVGANAAGEALGLGLSLGLTGLIFSRLEGVAGAAAVLVAFVGAVVSGAIESTVVGLAQWWAMHPWFSWIGRGAWWRATFAGALIAYGLGYLPSTLMDLSRAADETAAPMTEPPQVVVLLLAAGLGAVAGAVLSFAQYRVLRGRIARAGWWIPANMGAWAVGMPLIFWAIDRAFLLPEIWQAAALMVTALVVMGAVVGAIHGVVLVRLARTASSIG